MASACPPCLWQMVVHGQGPEPGVPGTAPLPPGSQATPSFPALSPPGCSHRCKSAHTASKMPFGAGKVGVGIFWQTRFDWSRFRSIHSFKFQEEGGEQPQQRSRADFTQHSHHPKKNPPLTPPPELFPSSKGRNKFL